MSIQRIRFALFRSNMRRFAAVFIAIMIASAYVHTTFIATNTLTAGITKALANNYRGADLIVDANQASAAADLRTTPQPDQDDSKILGAEIEGHASGKPAPANAKPYSDADLNKVPGVGKVRNATQQYVNAIGKDSSNNIPVQAANQDPRFLNFTLDRGTRAIAKNTIVLTAEAASDLNVGVGDTIKILANSLAPPDAGADAAGASANSDQNSDPTTDPGTDSEEYLPPDYPTIDNPLLVKVVGVMAPQDQLSLFNPVPSQVNATALDAMFAGSPQTLLITFADGADAATTRTLIQRYLDSTTMYGVPIQSAEAAFDAVVNEATFGVNMLDYALKALAAIAVFIAALVIGNTFTVVVAQRTQQFALLRLIGADKKQIRGMVRREAWLVGAAGGLAGVVLSAIIMQIVLGLVPVIWGPTVLPSTVSVSWQGVLITLFAAVLITMLAARRPGTAATKVWPLQALRDMSLPVATMTQNRTKTIWVIILAVLGLSLSSAMFWLTDGADYQWRMLLCLIGGIALSVAALILIVIISPAVVSLIGRVFLLYKGATTKLAVANVRRNQRRISVTVSALAIGVSLLAFVSMSAGNAQATVQADLRRTTPVDFAMIVGSSSEQYSESTDPTADPLHKFTYDPAVEISPELVAKIRAIPGSKAVVPLLGVERYLAITTHGTAGELVGDSAVGEVDPSVEPSVGSSQDPGESTQSFSGLLLAATPAQADQFGLTNELSQALATGKFVVPKPYWTEDKVKKIVLTDRKGTRDSPPITTVESNISSTIFATPELVAKYSNGDPLKVRGVMIRLEPATDANIYNLALEALIATANPGASSEATDIREAHVASGTPDASGAIPELEPTEAFYSLSGSAVEMVGVQQALLVFRGVMLGLLSIAVLISVIGVSNTLGLSVLERNREHALMRALGLPRRNLYQMLTLEGVMVALAGTLLGIIFGSLLAVLGSYAVARGYTQVYIDTPWFAFALFVVGAVVAGILASLVPARTAAKVHPAHALADD